MVKDIISVFFRIRNKLTFPSKTKLTREVLVIGESHARAYSFNKNFFPVFIGAGKEFNFTSSECYAAIKSSTKRVLNEIEVNHVLLTFGEPDCRFYMGLGWYPWEGEETKLTKDASLLLKDSIERYKNYLTWLTNQSKSVYVQPVAPSMFKRQDEYARVFNNQIRSFCETNRNLYFLSSLEGTLWSTGDRIAEFYGDHVHLNTKIQDVVEEELILLKVLTSKEDHKEHTLTSKSIQARYEFNDRFGCYIPKK